MSNAQRIAARLDATLALVLRDAVAGHRGEMGRLVPRGLVGLRNYKLEVTPLGHEVAAILAA